MKHFLVLITTLAICIGCKDKCDSPCPADYDLIEGIWVSIDSTLVQDTSGWNYIHDTVYISKDPIPELGYIYDYVFATHGSKPAFYTMNFYDQNQLDLVYMGPSLIKIEETFTHTITLSDNNQYLEIIDLKTTYPASFFNRFKKIQ